MRLIDSAWLSGHFEPFKLPATARLLSQMLVSLREIALNQRAEEPVTNSSAGDVLLINWTAFKLN